MQMSTKQQVQGATILLASLAEQEARRAHVAKNIAGKVPFAFVESVDGRPWTDEETDSYLSDEMKALRARTLAQGATWLVSGAVACAVTHRDRLMGNVSAPGRFLCEDDVEFDREFLSAVADESAIRTLSALNGIVLLNYRSGTPIQAEKTPVARVGRYTVHRALTDVVSSAAYFMTPEVAARVRTFQTPVHAPADHWSAMKKGGALDEIFLVHPAPVDTGHFPTSINYGRKEGSWLVRYFRQHTWLRRLRWWMLRVRGQRQMGITQFV